MTFVLNETSRRGLGLGVYPVCVPYDKHILLTGHLIGLVLCKCKLSIGLLGNAHTTYIASYVCLTSPLAAISS